MNGLFFGLWPICRKEFTHILRDPGTLFFALLLPLIQLFMFGYAVDTNVRQITTRSWTNRRRRRAGSLLPSSQHRTCSTWSCTFSRTMRCIGRFGQPG